MNYIILNVYILNIKVFFHEGKRCQKLPCCNGKKQAYQNKNLQLRG